jgi:hypothetical protein
MEARYSGGQYFLSSRSLLPHVIVPSRWKPRPVDVDTAHTQTPRLQHQLVGSAALCGSSGRESDRGENVLGRLKVVGWKASGHRAPLGSFLSFGPTGSSELLRLLFPAFHGSQEDCGIATRNHIQFVNLLCATSLASVSFSSCQGAEVVLFLGWAGPP